jgi:hypothetical protein
MTLGKTGAIAGLIHQLELEYADVIEPYFSWDCD